MKRRKMALVFGGIAGALLFVFVGLSIEICHLSYYVCRNTLSIQGHKTWPLGITSDYWQKSSPLETYLSSRGERVDHDWKRVSSTGKNLFWTSVSFSDGVDGQLSSLNPERLAIWMEGKSDKDIRALHGLLKNGERREVHARVQEISMDVLNRK